IYQQASRKAMPGARITLKVRVPDCLYRVYFLKGCVVNYYDATCDNTYENWNRVVEVVEGGTCHCKPKPPVMVEICHINPNTGEQMTVEVPEGSVQEHIDHGDYLGVCKADTHPPVDSTCRCDYDKDGRPD